MEIGSSCSRILKKLKKIASIWGALIRSSNARRVFKQIKCNCIKSNSGNDQFDVELSKNWFLCFFFAVRRGSDEVLALVAH